MTICRSISHLWQFLSQLLLLLPLLVVGQHAQGNLLVLGKVLKLDCQASVLGDRFEDLLLIPQTDVALLLDLLGEAGDVRAAFDEVTFRDVSEVKHCFVLLAHMSEPELDTCAVLGRGPDDILKDLGYIDRDLPLKGLLLLLWGLG